MYKRESLGSALSTSALMLSLTISLSMITGEVLLGFSTGHPNTPDIAVFIDEREALGAVSTEDGNAHR